MQQISQAQELAQTIRRSCLGARIDRLHRAVARRFEQALRPLGLSRSQLEILTGLILLDGPVKPAVLAEVLGVERSTMSRNLTLMEASGLVVTTQTSAAGRSLTVTITEQGTGALLQAETAWTEVQSAVAGLLGTEAPAILGGWIGALATVSAPPRDSGDRAENDGPGGPASTAGPAGATW